MAQGSGTNKVVTRAELLRLHEKTFRAALAGKSLLAEFEVKPAVTEQALNVLGYKYIRCATDWERSRVLSSHPAVHAVSTSRAATEHYSNGTFWPQLCKIAGVPNTAETQQEWGKAFIENLARLGLPSFVEVDAGARFVGRILMHSGVPTYCLPDYFRLVHSRRQAAPGLQPDEFVAWAAERAEQDRLPSTDKPVQRFLRFGSNFAVDMSDRAFELLDTVLAGADGLDVPLPARFARVAVAMRDRGELQGRSHRAESRTDLLDHQPHLVLDPYGRGPLLRLPPVHDTEEGTVTWLVTLDREQHRVRSTSLWPARNEPAPAVDLPITRPCRLATAALDGHSRFMLPVSVVSDEDPLIVFAEDGKWLGTELTLPAAPVWLLFPGDGNAVVYEGHVPTTTHGTLPPGWTGWTLVLADLSKASAVRLSDGRRRPIRTFVTARIIMDDPLEGVRTIGGGPIFTTLPKVSIPTSLTDATWSLSVTDEHGVVVVRHDIASDADNDELWAGLERPVAGDFTLKIRGPWGRSASRRVTVVEGLNVTSKPTWRVMTRNGLTPCVVDIAGPGLGLSSTRLDLDSKATEKPLFVQDVDSHLTLRVQPPHMSVTHVSETGASAPSISALSLYVEDVLADPGVLVVGIGKEAAPTLRLLSGGTVLQRIDPGKRAPGGVYRFDLSRLTDTLRTTPNCRLALDDQGQAVLAHLRPRRLFSGVEIIGQDLRFLDCVDIPDLNATLYLAHAPWRGAVVVPIESGRAPLPSALIDAGPLLVSARIDDPWVPEPVLPWPEVGTSTYVHAEGYFTSEDEDETSLSAFLAGASPVPPGAGDPGRIWDTLARLRTFPMDSGVRSRESQLSAALRDRPAQALASLAQTSLSQPESVRLLVRSGMATVAARSDSRHAVVGAVDDSWTLGNALPRILFDWSTEDAAEARDVLGLECAEVAAGADPCASAGRFDQAADFYAGMTAEQRRAFQVSVAFVPRGLLHPDSRALAAQGLVENRGHSNLRHFRRNGPLFLVGAEGILQREGCRAGLNAVRERKHPNATKSWHVLPAWSMSMAFMARLAARGSEPAASHIRDNLEMWSDLAGVAPDLVMIDLVIAELTLCATEKDEA